MIDEQQQAPAETALRFTHGSPSAEEIAAVTAVLAAMQNAPASADASAGTGIVRRTSVRRRRLLASAPQPWRTGRH